MIVPYPAPDHLLAASHWIMKSATTSADTSTSGDASTAATSRTATHGKTIRYRTLYFVRHGEARHNILEKAARKQAKEDAIAEGYAEDSEETMRRMEVARQKILNDESLLDASLSPTGMDEAKGARKDIERIIKEKNIPPPTEVLVSPLQRALQTARIVFPNHKNIHVREEVRERLTGKACDTRISTFKMARRDTFRDFSMGRQMRNSFKRKAKSLPAGIVDKLESAKNKSLRSLFGSQGGSSSGGGGDMNMSSGNTGYEASTTPPPDHHPPNNSPNHATTPTSSGRKGPDFEKVVEDKHQLRERTRKLFDLIAESRHDVIAVVTHKGFLRELERGPFGQEDATEFTNCEVRVYKAGFVGISTDLQHVERIA